MRGQYIADGANSMGRSQLEFAGGKMPAHFPTDAFPDRIAHTRLYAAISKNFNSAISKQDVYQHAAVVLGIPYTQDAKQLHRPRARMHSAEKAAGRQPPFHNEAKLAIVSLLLLPDDLPDGCKHGSRKLPPSQPIRRAKMFQPAYRAHVTISPRPRRRRSCRRLR